MSISILNRGASGGLKPELTVTAPAGSTIDLLQNGIIVATYTLGADETEHTFVVKIGTYTVRGTLGADVQTIEINVDTTAHYSALINYKPNYDMLYDSGVIGNIIPNGFRTYKKASDPYRCAYVSEDSISFTDYASMLVICENVAGGNGRLEIFVGPADGSYSEAWYSYDSSKKFKMRFNVSGWGTNVLSFGAYASGATYTIVMETAATYLRTYLQGYYGGDGRWYTFALCGEDDWEKLAEIAGISASSQTNLISQASTIFNNANAVKHMASVCTGDFMAEAVLNSTFISALNASAYKNLVYDNKHWSKFLAMVQ